MSSFHGLHGRELAYMSWRQFANFYRALLYREYSAYRLWRDAYLENNADEMIIEEQDVTDVQVANAFGVPFSAIEKAKPIIIPMPAGGFD